VERATINQAHDLPTSSASSAPVPTIIFSCPSKINWFANTVYPIIFCTIYIYLLFWVISPSQSVAERLVPTIFCGVEFAILLVVYLAVLPYRLEVQSDSSLLVRACLRSVCYSQIVGAYPEPCTGCCCYTKMCSRIYEDSSFSNRVVVKRLDPDKDVVVRPVDLDGFLRAIQQVVMDIEQPL
jgi:hypothetical protein